MTRSGHRKPKLWVALAMALALDLLDHELDLLVTHLLPFSD
jgi:hypothetical protein